MVAFWRGQLGVELGLLEDSLLGGLALEGRRVDARRSAFVGIPSTTNPTLSALSAITTVQLTKSSNWLAKNTSAAHPVFGRIASKLPNTASSYWGKAKQVSNCVCTRIESSLVD